MIVCIVFNAFSRQGFELQKLIKAISCKKRNEKYGMQLNIKENIIKK